MRIHSSAISLDDSVGFHAQASEDIPIRLVETASRSNSDPCRCWRRRPLPCARSHATEPSITFATVEPFPCAQVSVSSTSS